MVPNVTASTCLGFVSFIPELAFAGMAVQISIFIPTFAISGRSALVYYGLGSILLTMDQAPFYSWAFPYKLLASFTTDYWFEERA
ncbi:hypothetical protein B0H13DRAFT_2066420, partial [Mycena leptocephala]